MRKLTKIWTWLRTLFREGFLSRGQDGRRLGFFSARAIGANGMLAGLIALLIAVIWTSDRLIFEIDARSTTARVLVVDSSRTENGGTVYGLTLEWTDHNGETHVTTPGWRSSAYNFPVGSTIAIDYDPGDEGDVRIQTEHGPWFWPKLMFMGGLLTLFLGWLLRRLGRP